ncbi:MAG: 6-carboxytetrahydropterin synthase, partial [Candidatus Marinimicrobia bacterium]|nr:6-carboxytetrahydropterin synthase [Candidatus Neomarinimicrobiota bacterium]
GEINPETGFIIDLGQLRVVVEKNIIEVLDHAQIEKDIAWFKDKQPSSENMVVFIWETIEPLIKDVALHRVRLIETPTIKTDYYG